MPRVLEVRWCESCGGEMERSGRYPKPLRWHWRCPLCGSWCSVTTRSGRLHGAHWRRALP